jgi:hypothetical protein
MWLGAVCIFMSTPGRRMARSAVCPARPWCRWPTPAAMIRTIRTNAIRWISRSGRPSSPGSRHGPVRGGPGWHIECSTMAHCFLGQTIDIHGGGADLLFPHHECEKAQSESVAPQQPCVRYWFHAAMVRGLGHPSGTLSLRLISHGQEPSAPASVPVQAP